MSADPYRRLVLLALLGAGCQGSIDEPLVPGPPPAARPSPSDTPRPSATPTPSSSPSPTPSSTPSPTPSSEPGTRFSRALRVLQSNCWSCHDAGGTAAFAPLSFTTEDRFIEAGMVSPGSLASSKLIYRLRNYPLENGLRNMPLAPAQALSESDYAVLTDWVLNIPVAPRANAFRCDPGEPPALRDAQRLSRAEYASALRSLLLRALGPADTAAALARLDLEARLPAPIPGAYSTSDASFSVIHATQYFEIADQLSSLLVSDANYPRFVDTYVSYAPGSCVLGSPETLSAACQEALIRNFLLRAWGRPPEGDEANGNDELAAFQQEFQLAGTSRGGVEALIMKALLAPEFLFHLEISLGAPVGDAYPLSSHAIARRLAFLFTQSPPDEALLALAQASDLSLDAPFAEAVRYVSGRSDPALSEFTREWLHLAQLPAFTEQDHPKAQRISQGLVLDEALRSAMRDEVVELMTYTAKAGRPAEELLTSRISFARNPSLVRIYGLSSPAPAVVTEANAVRFPAGERSGLLTRAALLMSGGHTENPILRGSHLRKYLLCLPMPQPMNLPPDALAPPVPDAQRTTRQRYHDKTSGQPCAGCHSLINPLGFAFSNYNALGAYQPLEPIYDQAPSYVGELPTDSSASLAMAINLDRQVRDGNELSQVLSMTDAFRSCLTRNFYAYASRLPELPSSTDSCAMNRMFEALSAQAPLQEFFTSAARDPRFRARTLRR